MNLVGPASFLIENAQDVELIMMVFTINPRHEIDIVF